MGNNMNCESCSANTRNMTHQRDMMHQREMMYQRDMRMPRRRCDVPEPCENQRIMPQCEESCERNRTRCEGDYSRGRDMLYGVPLAMGYVPWQNFECTYEPAQALKAGTIFPELDKPFYGRRGVRL